MLVEVYLAMQLVYRHSTQIMIIGNRQSKYNIPRSKTPTSRRQPVGYLWTWRSMWILVDHQETNPGDCQSESNLGLPDCKSDMLITRPCCPSDRDDKFIFMILCFLDKFEASKGLNCCCPEAWSCWQISNSTSSKKAGKEIMFSSLFFDWERQLRLVRTVCFLCL